MARRAGGSSVPLSLGGVAVVCCVHDREKRVITDREQAIRLGQEFGYDFDPAKHVFQTCSCCENVFATFTDAPMRCPVCSGVSLPALGAD